MRNSLFLAGALAIVAFGVVGCAGPEKKMGRGIANMTEIARLSEFQRGIEQGNMLGGPDVGIASGAYSGFHKTLARTGLGIYEVITFPFPPYDPVCTRYISAEPQYPDSYKPGVWADSMTATDHDFGFSGGDVAPWFPGSRFRVFDN